MGDGGTSVRVNLSYEAEEGCVLHLAQACHSVMEGG